MLFQQLRTTMGVNRSVGFCHQSGTCPQMISWESPPCYSASAVITFLDFGVPLTSSPCVSNCPADVDGHRVVQQAIDA